MVPELYTENLQKKEDWNRLRHVLCSWIRKLNIVKVAILSKLTIDSMQSKISAGSFFFTDIDKVILKFIWKNKGTRLARQFLKGRTTRVFYSLISRLNCEATVIKTGWFWWKKQTHQWNELQNPEIGQHISTDFPKRCKGYLIVLSHK